MQNLFNKSDYLLDSFSFLLSKVAAAPGHSGQVTVDWWASWSPLTHATFLVSLLVVLSYVGLPVLLVTTLLNDRR